MQSNTNFKLLKTGTLGIILNDNNLSLDVLTVFFIIIAGILIQLFFAPNKSVDGTIGPSNSNIWGGMLSCLGVFLLIFIVYGIEYNKTSGNPLIQSFPIFVLLCIISYSVIINFLFSRNINMRDGTDITFDTYSFVSNLLIIIQTILVFKHVFSSLHNNSEKQTDIYKSVFISLFIGVLNLCTLIIMHIMLYFYSTSS
tara:strand:+ start:7235 stop:7828 length:594 start_codon:yes stop_codon:yes gene_type:complete